MYSMPVKTKGGMQKETASGPRGYLHAVFWDGPLLGVIRNSALLDAMGPARPLPLLGLYSLNPATSQLSAPYPNHWMGSPGAQMGPWILANIHNYADIISISGRYITIHFLNIAYCVTLLYITWYRLTMWNIYIDYFLFSRHIWYIATIRSISWLFPPYRDINLRNNHNMIMEIIYCAIL